MKELSQQQKTRVKLELGADLIFLPLVRAYVSHASLALGLGEAEANDLALTAEKIFSNLCGVLSRSKRIKMSCVGGGYFIDQEFEVNLVEFEERASSGAVSDPHLLLEKTDDIDLDLEIQLVDTFRLVQKKNTLCIILKKHKQYPSISSFQVAAEIISSGSYSVREPDADELGRLVVQAYYAYPLLMLHSSFLHPGKVVDMVASGDFFSVVAVDDRGNVAGGIVGRRQGAGNRLVEFYGPYVFVRNQREELAQLLVNKIIEMFARTHAIALAIFVPTPELPKNYFEPVGSLSFTSDQRELSTFTTYFRHLGEDPGTRARVHRLLVPFVEEIYQRLALPRELIVNEEYGESLPLRSIIAVDHISFLSRAILRPMWSGQDTGDNIMKHSTKLMSQGYKDIFFELDLGIPWHSLFVPALFDCGFKPASILPYAGKGDLVIFERNSLE